MVYFSIARILAEYFNTSGQCRLTFLLHALEQNVNWPSLVNHVLKQS